MQSLILLSFVLVDLGTSLPTPQSLRGPPELLGYNPSNVLSKEDTHAVNYSPVPGQKQSANIGAYLNFENSNNPQPIRGTKGGTDPGPRNSYYDKINSDKLAPPGTDHGETINAQWPMGLSHNKLGLKNAGWSRQENTVVRIFS